MSDKCYKKNGHRITGVCLTGQLLKKWINLYYCSNTSTTTHPHVLNFSNKIGYTRGLNDGGGGDNFIKRDIINNVFVIMFVLKFSLKSNYFSTLN